ncbi:protein abrupt isoform X2 [Procambarus clarkii]|uniref:protein abrupt isoform X2 n=1 Tax=Procambarus clarkii TaxID=6728 RepID=UPI0037447CA2
MIRQRRKTWKLRLNKQRPCKHSEELGSGGRICLTTSLLICHSIEAYDVLHHRMGEPRRCWLRWHNYSDSVTSALESLRYDEDFLDVTVACEGRTIRAHKLVLSACSAYFRKVLKDHPCDHPIIILDGLGWREVVALLHFMYCGEVVVEEDHLPNLLNAASNLNVTGLTHVTSALASTQIGGEDDSDEDDFDDEEEDEEDDDLKISEIQTSKKDIESEGDSSYDSDAPPSKRQRTDSSDLQQGKCNNSETVEGSLTESKGSFSSSKNSNNATVPVTSSSHIQEVLAATPVDVPPINDTSDKENEKGPINLLEKNNKELKNIRVKIMNGDCHIKDEMEDLDEVESIMEAVNSGRLENGDSDSLKTSLSISLTKPVECVMPANLMDGTTASDATPSLGAVSYAAFLATGGILPVNSGKPSTTILLTPSGLGSSAITDGTINMEKMVQLLPSLPTTGTLPTTITPLTAGTTLTTATGTTLSTTTNLVTTCSGQPYIHPSLVSVKEVQATLEQYQRKLAFHEPRPCPTCKRMYRDAATLRTHMAIMHAEGKEPFSCTCGALFRTKYDMYQHKKNGHR